MGDSRCSEDCTGDAGGQDCWSNQTAIASVAATRPLQSCRAFVQEEQVAMSPQWRWERPWGWLWAAQDCPTRIFCVARRGVLLSLYKYSPEQSDFRAGDLACVADLRSQIAVLAIGDMAGRVGLCRGRHHIC